MLLGRSPYLLYGFICRILPFMWGWSVRGLASAVRNISQQLLQLPCIPHRHRIRKIINTKPVLKPVRLHWSTLLGKHASKNFYTRFVEYGPRSLGKVILQKLFYKYGIFCLKTNITVCILSSTVLNTNYLGNVYFMNIFCSAFSCTYWILLW